MTAKLSQFEVQLPLSRRVSRESRRAPLAVTQSLNFPSRRGAQASRAAAAAAGDSKKKKKKRGTTSWVVETRGHIRVHATSGRRKGAIVLQLSASRDGPGAPLISLLPAESEPESRLCPWARLSRCLDARLSSTDGIL